MRQKDFGKLEPEYVAPYTAWQQQQTPQTTGALLRAAEPILSSAMHSYGGGAAGSPTLRSRAKQMAISAFKSYDYTKGSLRTHLLSQLRGLQRPAAKEQQVIRIPEQVGLDHALLAEADKSFRDQFGREPSDGELMDILGIPAKRLTRLRSLQLPTAEGTATRVTEDGPMVPGIDMLGRDDELKAWQQFVYNDLDPIGQLIMEYSLGMHGKPQLATTEIAKKLQLSSSAISQRAARIQQMLNQRNELDLF